MKFKVIASSGQIQQQQIYDADGKPIIAERNVQHVTMIPDGETPDKATYRLDLQIMEPSDDDVLAYRTGTLFEHAPAAAKN